MDEASPLQEQASDVELRERVCRGDEAAFEILVRRNQSAVCAVAYSVCGDLVLSEDVAQETFRAAWRGRQTAIDSTRLRAWLCGIARNIARNAHRRESRSIAAGGGDAADVGSADTDSAVNAVTKEKEALVRQTLQQIPETYREPLILFYREEQSIAEVAASLDLSVDSVKQRIARGRGLLRDRVAKLVEGTLRRGRPGRALTLAVMSGLTVASVGAKRALGAPAAVAAAAAGPALKSIAGFGLAGGLLGSLLGLGGGWMGVWLPAQFAPSKREHQLRMRFAVRSLLVSLFFAAVLLIPILIAASGRPIPVVTYMIFRTILALAFTCYTLVETLLLVQAIRRIRREQPAEPNENPLRMAVSSAVGRYRGRVYRSRSMLLGLPLVDINVADPGYPINGEERPQPSIARGWVAIGDDAGGVLFALGGSARGIVAIGGRAIGVLSIGGLAVGLVAFGGAAIGGLAIGGGALGILSIGGMGIGWQAAGGGALAWNTACGGGAAALENAFGGCAIARDYAVGGSAFAAHANDAAAKAVLLNHPLKRAMEWYIANQRLAMVAVLVPALILPLVLSTLMYRRQRGPSMPEGGSVPTFTASAASFA